MITTEQITQVPTESVTMIEGGSGGDWLLVALLLLAIFWPEPGKRKKPQKPEDEEN